MNKKRVKNVKQQAGSAIERYSLPSDKSEFRKVSNKQSFKARGHKIDYRGVLKYFAYVVVMILLSMAKTGGGVSPFTLGFIMALVYCGENPFVLSIGYIIAMVIAMPKLSTLVIAFIAPLIIVAITFMHKLLKRQLKMIHINFYSLICQLPTILLLAPRGGAALITSIATLVLSQIFTYSSCIFIYAMLIRGVKYRFATDELVGGLILLAALGMGLFSINIYGFQPYYLVTALFIMLTVLTGRMEAAVISALTLGMGAGVLTANIMMSGGLMLAACGGLIFCNYNRYLAALGYLMADILAGMFFNAYGLYGYLHLVSVASGLLIFVLIPKTALTKLKGVFGGFKDNINVRSMLSRSSKELNGRLNYLSGVFHDMGDILLGEKVRNIDIRTAVDAVSKEVAAEYCYRCPNVKSCMRALGGDTAQVIRDLVIIAEQVGRVTANQITPFLSSRCARVVGLLDAVNTKVNLYKLKLSRDKDMSAGKVLMAEQMHAISYMFAGLANELKRPMTFDSDREKELISRFGYVNIICIDVMVSINDKEATVIMTIRDEDKSKSEIITILSEIMNCKMEITEITSSEHKGYVTMRFADEPPYDLAIGIATMIMTGSSACGDTYCMSGLSGGRFIVAICDGMGSGEQAHYNSAATIGMIESFYKAGFDNNAILNMINKLLSTYNNDNFTCLDMGIFDLKCGICDFIKLGAVDGYIRRDNEVIKIESGALPLGIVEEATPRCERKLLLNNDLAIFISDGIMDALGEELLLEMMFDFNGEDVQLLADKILRQATQSGAKDDSTIIVTKLIDRRKTK